MSSFLDEELGRAVDGVAAAVEALRRVGDEIDRDEPLRSRLEAMIAALEAATGELRGLADEAVDELL